MRCGVVALHGVFVEVMVLDDEFCSVYRALAEKNVVVPPATEREAAAAAKSGLVRLSDKNPPVKPPTLFFKNPAVQDGAADSENLLPFARGEIISVMYRVATPQWWYAMNSDEKWGLVPANFFKVPDLCSAARDDEDSYLKAKGIVADDAAKKKPPRGGARAGKGRDAAEVELTPEQKALQALTKMIMCVEMFPYPTDSSNNSPNGSPRGRRASRVNSPRRASGIKSTSPANSPR